MTDTAWHASVKAQDIILEILREAELILQHGNKLFHEPGSKELYLETLRASLSTRRSLADLDRLVRYSDE
jgi:hypothetical protein